jgi:hypothetical protein
MLVVPWSREEMEHSCRSYRLRNCLKKVARSRRLRRDQPLFGDYLTRSAGFVCASSPLFLRAPARSRTENVILGCTRPEPPASVRSRAQGECNIPAACVFWAVRRSGLFVFQRVYLSTNVLPSEKAVRCCAGVARQYRTPVLLVSTARGLLAHRRGLYIRYYRCPRRRPARP